jgi:hypothetical protein
MESEYFLPDFLLIPLIKNNLTLSFVAIEAIEAITSTKSLSELGFSFDIKFVQTIFSVSLRNNNPVLLTELQRFQGDVQYVGRKL